MTWLLLTAGRGPGECEIAVRRLLDLMVAEAGAASLTVDVLETEAGRHGLLSALVALDGIGVEAFAESWAGTIRWTFRSPLRPGWGRKNWFVGVSRLAPPTAAAAFDERDLRFEACRASGPGGQHVNKTNSAVRVVHVPTGLAATAQEERSQHRNRALAVARLAAALAERDDQAKDEAKQRQWSQHDQLQRGGETRAYRGPEFERLA